jgi:hypothetical protein
VLLAACGDSHKAKPADAPIDVTVPFDVACGGCDAPNDGGTAVDLFGTGLCADKACTGINPGIRAYTPRYALWADAASKRRWIYLPPGTKIDTTNPDYWVFPQGTKVWKEFSSGATRVETRFIEKVGAGNNVTDWFYMAYEWNTAQTDAMAVPFGDPNAVGTTHDIPSQSQCKACHENLQPTRVLGFGAIQLDAPAVAGELDLDGLISGGVLTANPPGASSPHYPLTNDTSNTYAPDALGYMHANCGHCHNSTSNVYMFNGVTMVLRMSVADATVSATPQYSTSGPPFIGVINQPRTSNSCCSVCDANAPVPGKQCNLATDCQDGTHTTGACVADMTLVVPGDPTHSVLTNRFESTNSANWMPQLGHKTMDPAGDTLLQNWITHLQ